MSNVDTDNEILNLALPRETIRKLDFIIRFCNIIPEAGQIQYNSEQLKPAILTIRRQIHKTLFPDEH